MAAVASSAARLSPPMARAESGGYARRPAPSAGGGRAWSEEEETFLIETRRHKLPYKHIAAQLQKTELACRLHYHQLSFGTKRRRRASSASSRTSLAAPSDLPPVRRYASHTPQPTLSPPASPQPLQRPRTREASPVNAARMLPRPFAESRPLDRQSNSSTGSHHSRSHSGSSKSMLDYLGSLDALEPRLANGRRVDRERLADIYDGHKSIFWAAIAREYGRGATADMLEDIWRRQASRTTLQWPPTPPHSHPVRARGSPEVRHASPVPSPPTVHLSPPRHVVLPVPLTPGPTLAPVTNLGSTAKPTTAPTAATSSTSSGSATTTTTAAAPAEPATLLEPSISSVSERLLPNTFYPVNTSRSSTPTPSASRRNSFAISSLLSDPQPARNGTPSP